MKFNSSLSTLLLASLLVSTLSACVVEPPPHRRPPQPPPIVEVVPERPAPAYHWVQGYHRWDGERWVWIRGHWAPN